MTAKTGNRAFSLLFVSLLLLLVVSPFFGGTGVGRVILRFLFTLVLLSAVHVASANRHNLIIAACLAVPWLAVTWTGVGPALGAQGIIGSGLLMGLSVFVFCIVMVRLHRADEVDLDIVCGALALYLLIAVTWAISYMIIQWVDPGSFAGLDGDIDWQPFLYFSLTTITTLGYGDIAPVSPFARIWSTLEAVTGVLYIAVLIARFVSLYRR